MAVKLLAMKLMISPPHVSCNVMDDVIVDRHLISVKIKKVKFSHTRYRALGPELIPVYRQSARR